MNSTLQNIDAKTLQCRLPSEAQCDGHMSVRLEALGVMTAGIVHDLANIIQVFSSTIELLERHPAIKATTSLQSPMRRAASSVARANALTAQILRFARGGTAEHERVDLKECLMGLKPLLHWIGNDRVHLDIQVDTDAPTVVCNRSDLENAILNLVRNARDAMPGRGTLSITVMPRRNGPVVTGVAVSVSDTGHGMSPQTMARALEPFFSTKTAARGNGLGLMMVHRFAQAAGGNVTIESRPGLGTTVTLLLPQWARTPEG